MRSADQPPLRCLAISRAASDLTKYATPSSTKMIESVLEVSIPRSAIIRWPISLCRAAYRKTSFLSRLITNWMAPLHRLHTPSKRMIFSCFSTVQKYAKDHQNPKVLRVTRCQFSPHGLIDERIDIVFELFHGGNMGSILKCIQKSDQIDVLTQAQFLFEPVFRFQNTIGQDV